MNKKNKEKKEKSAVPETTFQLVWMMIKGFVKSIPKTGIKLVIRSAIMFAAIMLFNIYMLAEINDGFNPTVSEQSPYYGFMNFAGNKLAFNTLCFLVMFFITSLFTQIKVRGIKKFLLDLITSPIWAFKCLKKGKHTFYVFFITFGIVSLAGIAYKNIYVFLTLAISIFLGFTAKGEGMGSMVVNIIFSDFQRIFRYGKEKVKLDAETIGVLTLSALLGIITLIFIPNQNKLLFGIVMPIICIGLVILVSMKLLTKKTAAHMFVFMAMNLVYFTYTNTVFADDGGKPEAGGTWGNWFGSPGSNQIIKSGVQPGVLGILGSWLASAASTVWSGVKGAADTYNDYTFIASETVKGMITQIASTAVHVIKRGAVEFVGVGVDLGHGIRALYDDPELLKDFGAGIKKDLDTIYDATLGQIVKLGEGVVSLVKDEGLRDAFFTAVSADLSAFETSANQALNSLSNSAWHGLSDAYQATSEVFSDPYAVAEFLGGTVVDAATFWTNPASLIEPYQPQIQSALGSVWHAFSNTLNDPEKVYQVIKDMVGADNFANSWDPDRSVWDRIGQSLWGTFELGGAASAVKDMGTRGAQIYDDIVKNNMDDDLVRSLNNLTDEAGNLGQNGAYIQTEYTNPNFIPDETKKVIQELSEKYNVKIHVRPGNADSVQWFVNGQAVPKPVDLKMKTINAIDEMIGARADQKGLVGFFNPKRPPNYDLLDDFTRIQVDNRIAQRAQEFTKYSNEMANSTRYNIVDNVVIDTKTGKFVAGDVDLFSVTRADGSALSRAEANRLESIFANTQGSNMEHGSVLSWDPSDVKYNPDARNSMVEATRRGSEGLVTFNPDTTITQTYVRTGEFRGPTSSSLWSRLFGAEQAVTPALSQ